MLEPLVGQCRSCDIVIVQVNPTCRDALPSTVEDITNRVNEISFNSSLLREMRAIAWGNALVEAGVMEIKDARYRCIRFHRIAAEEIMAGLRVRSKFDTSWPFLLRLRDLGRERADRWLAEHFKDLGNRSTSRSGRLGTRAGPVPSAPGAPEYGRRCFFVRRGHGYFERIATWT